MRRLLIPVLALVLAACGASSDEPPSGTPDAADEAAADAQSPAGNATIEKPSAKDVQLAGNAIATVPTVGMDGYGAVLFGMGREEAERAATASLGNSAVAGSCEPARGSAPSDIVYLFPDDKLQRIDVRKPDILADGGGHVGMQIDEIRTLYAGRLKEQAVASVKGGHELKVAGKDGSGIIFQTDADGKVIAFRAGVGAVLDGPVACP